MDVIQCYIKLHGDYNDAKSRLMNDTLIEKYLKKFLSDPTMSDLLQAVEDGDIERSFRAAHTMKGVAGNMGFTELIKAASDLTEQLRPRTEQADPVLLQAMKDAYQLVVETIKNEG